MFCKKCGAQMDDSAKVCPSCGASTEAKAPVVAGGPVEKARANPLFLAAVICMSVVALFQLIGVFQGGGQMGSVMDAAGMGGANALMTLVSLIALAITAVLLVGLWFIYVSGLNSAQAPLLGKGLHLTNIGVLAQMIYMIVVLSFAVLGMVIVAIGGGAIAGQYSADAGGALAAAGIVGALLLGGVGALMVVFYLKARAAVQMAESTVAAGKLTGVPVMFVPVMCFVMGGLTVVTMLTSMGAGALTLLNNLASAGSYILFGIVALQYRNENMAA